MVKAKKREKGQDIEGGKKRVENFKEGEEGKEMNCCKGEERRKVSPVRVHSTGAEVINVISLYHPTNKADSWH